MSKVGYGSVEPELKDWFESLEPRERLTLLAGAGLLTLILLWVVLVGPLYAAADKRKEQLTTMQANLIRASELSAEISSHGATGPARSVQGQNQSLMIVLERSARGAGLQINRSQPVDADSVRVRFENAPFDSVVRWLAQLASSYSVQVDTASMERRDTPGMIDAQLTLKRSAT